MRISTAAAALKIERDRASSTPSSSSTSRAGVAPDRAAVRSVPRASRARELPALAFSPRANEVGDELVQRVQRDTSRGRLGIEEATKLFTFVLSGGRRETAAWTDMNALLKGLPPRPMKASGLLQSASLPLPEQRRKQRSHGPAAMIDGRHPLDDHQLRALIDAYGADLAPEAEARLETIFARVAFTGNAEERKLLMAKRLWSHEQKRGALDDHSTRKLSTIFGIGGSTADWTYFVNIEARSSLAYRAIQDVDEMGRVGSVPGELNVVALVTSGGGTRFLHLRKDENDPAKIVSVEKTIDPECALGRLLAASPDRTLNPSDPEVVRAAIEYVKAEFPSKHLAVDLWGHGSRLGDESARVGTVLNPRDITRALSGFDVDLVAFDACSMGTYEAASAAEAAGAKRFVASQYPVAGEGYSYDRLLSRASALTRGDRVMSGEELGKVIVDEYVDEAIEEKRLRIESMASIDLQRFPRIREKVDALAQAMLAEGGLAKDSALKNTFSEALETSFDDGVDLGDLTRLLRQKHPGPIGAAAASLEEELASATYLRSAYRDERVSFERSFAPIRGPEDRERLSGLSIFVPSYYEPEDRAEWATKPGPWTELLKTLPGVIRVR